LSADKAQGIAVGRGFRFLKDPLFCADSLFLKRPERLMALLMVMGLALLVYALAEHPMRTELVRGRKSLPNQQGKPTQQPTMRWIFHLFEGIDVLWLRQPTGVQCLVLNLKPIHRQILTLSWGRKFKNVIRAMDECGMWVETEIFSSLLEELS
jgi:transposase